MPSNAANPLFLFDASRWLVEPDAAFDWFLTEYRFGGRSLRPSSFKIYRGMFARLRAWAKEQGVELLGIDVPTIEHFLGSRRLSAESRHRYLLFFTAMFEHLTLLSSEPSELPPDVANPARSLLLQQTAPARFDPDFLSEAEVHRFIAALPQSSNWKSVRDQALALMVLGAGLRSAEVLALRVTDVVCKDDIPVNVLVPAHPPRPARKAPIHPWATSGIANWLKLREIYVRGEGPRYRGKDQRLAGSLLFPGGLTGGPLQPVTLFRMVKSTLEAAGLSKRYEGPTLLRNSCGALWLQKHDPLEVKLWMGHETARTTELLLPEKLRKHQSSKRR